MELFSMEFLSALLSIIIIDLVLAGDNAIVIGLAARNLPKHQQKKAVIWGTVGAVVIRALATLFVVWLLKVPGLLLIGGILLVWIAYKLLVEEKGHDVEAVGSLWEAIRTIIIADALMGLDNVLAVAGAAHGSFLFSYIRIINFGADHGMGKYVNFEMDRAFPNYYYNRSGSACMDGFENDCGRAVFRSVFC